ncbi:hypothetical protein IPM09_04905 [Candidatus Saccharibacteria bacterium]|nr:MAG: hypothetical protein IPM09_04905 [Candidatus Saccharibacteria bacterium]
MALTVIAGLLSRLYFYFKFSYNPISDPMTFYDTARAIAAGQSVHGDGYVAQFPYLAAYNNLLGVAMKIIPDPWLATILLNTLFDVLAAGIIYILLRKILRSGSNIPLIIFIIWILNPANVLYSLLSIPVIVVNFLIVAAILVAHNLLRYALESNTKCTLLYSVLFGLLIGYGNSFRPIFVVAIVAVALVYVMSFMRRGGSVRLLKLPTVSLLIVLAIFLGAQKINTNIVSNQIGIQVAENPSGVSLYVGSSWETTGQWKPYMNSEMIEICKESFANLKYEECHAKLRQVAVERYKNLGVINLGFLFISKLYHQAELQNYIYNAYQSIDGYEKSTTAKLMNFLLVMYVTVLFLLSTASLYWLSRCTPHDFATHSTVIFLALTLIGWFLSFMVMESAPRYSTILYPIFMVFLAIALDNSSRLKWINR